MRVGGVGGEGAGQVAGMGDAGEGVGGGGGGSRRGCEVGEQGDERAPEHVGHERGQRERLMQHHQRRRR